MLHRRQAAHKRQSGGAIRRPFRHERGFSCAYCGHTGEAPPRRPSGRARKFAPSHAVEASPDSTVGEPRGRQDDDAAAADHDRDHDGHYRDRHGHYHDRVVVVLLPGAPRAGIGGILGPSQA
jgi:hypothetical protein